MYDFFTLWTSLSHNNNQKLSHITTTLSPTTKSSTICSPLDPNFISWLHSRILSLTSWQFTCFSLAKIHGGTRWICSHWSSKLLSTQHGQKHVKCLYYTWVGSWQLTFCTWWALWLLLIVEHSKACALLMSPSLTSQKDLLTTPHHVARWEAWNLCDSAFKKMIASCTFWIFIPLSFSYFFLSSCFYKALTPSTSPLSWPVAK